MRILLIVCVLMCGCVNSQENKVTQTEVGGACEGCEALFEYGDKPLKSIDTITGFEQANNKLNISGTVYHKDSKTPAANIIIYVYHTDQNGRYPKRPQSSGWEARHGYLRGWVKTDAKGQYSFYTFRPASYPNTTIEQHIHMTVKEPDKTAYYIDDITFSDDPFLSNRTKNKSKPRGGKGLITLQNQAGILSGKRDIVLGSNIPDYP